MLDIKLIRQNLSEVEKALSTRGEAIDLESFKDFDAQRRLFLIEVEELRHRRNVVSDQIADLKHKGEDAASIVAEMREVSARIKHLERSLSEIEEELNAIISPTYRYRWEKTALVTLS
jgi:seryl-tRNA synthetase